MDRARCTAFDELEFKPRWVAWRNEARGKGGKPTKVPYGRGGKHAKADDEKTWIIRSEAETLAQQIVNGDGGGIGYELGDIGNDQFIAGIDLDSCLCDGTLAPWAAAILKLTDTYAEISPSGSGIKLFHYLAADDVRWYLDQIEVPATGWGCRRGIPGEDARDHGPAIEVYCRSRYFAVTENRWPGAPDALRLLDRDALGELARLVPTARGSDSTKWTAGSSSPLPAGGPAAAFAGYGSGLAAAAMAGIVPARRPDNSRSGAAYRLGCDLRRAGKTFEEMCEALRADPETTDWCREKADVDAGRQYRRIWDKAAPIVNDGAPPVPLTEIPPRQTAAEALGIMNSNLTFAHDWGGEPLVAHHQVDGSWRAMTEQHLKQSLANRHVVFPGTRKGGKPNQMPLALWWLQHPARREVDKVIFDPQGKWAGGGRILNLWTGLARQPAKGDCRLIIGHIRDIICNSNTACYNYLMRWLAHAVQFPGTAPGTVIVLRSDEESTGKSILLNIMDRVFGRHSILLNTPEQLTGRFNDHLEFVCFVGLNEPAFPGDHQQAAKLKSMITDPTWLIEGKYRGARRVPNIAHIAMTTNREWAVPAGNKARRFFVLDVSPDRVDDRPYFDALVHEMDHGGIEAFLDVLLQLPVSNGDLRDVPRTNALGQQQLLSANTMTRWAADAVVAGTLLDDFYPGPPLRQHDNGFEANLSTSALYKTYRFWCGKMHERPATLVAFGKWLSACGFTSKHTNSGTTWDIPDQEAFEAAVLRKAGIV